MKTYQIPTTDVVVSMLRYNICDISNTGAGDQPENEFGNGVPARKLYV